jgi:hypothetical protein
MALDKIDARPDQCLEINAKVRSIAVIFLSRYRKYQVLRNLAEPDW